MKSKKTWLLAFLCVLIFLALNIHLTAARAYSGIPFEPNVKIPGTSAFAKTSVMIDQDSIANYIVALYNYGAIFAGFVAMFMLVFAGWQWLMAAGRLDKISQAKNTINGVLIGLALLFGSYILMSQISRKLVNFATLNVTSPDIIPGMDSECANNKEVKKAGCGVLVKGVKSKNFGPLLCVSTTCPDPENYKCMNSNTGLACPSVLASFDSTEPKCSCVLTNCKLQTLNSCFDYKYDKASCQTNRCLGQVLADGSTFQQTCRWKQQSALGFECISLAGSGCQKNSDCDYDGSGTWCCEDTIFDSCKLRAETSKCGND